MTEVDGRALNTSASNPAQVSIPYPPKQYDLSIVQPVVGPPGPPGPPGAPGVPPLTTVDTATIDFTGAGVAGDPLKADVKPGSVGPPVPVFDEGGDATQWTKLGGSGTFASVNVADSTTGGNVLRCTGYTQMRRAALIPYDPNVLYRVRIRIRSVVDSLSAPPVGSVYAGLYGVAADGTTLVNYTGANSTVGHNYLACNATQIYAANGWQEFVGYTKGVAATGTTTVKPDPTAPGKMHQNVRYVCPLIFPNFSDPGPAIQEVDLFSVEIVPADALIAVADTATVDLTNTAGTVTADVKPGAVLTSVVDTPEVDLTNTAGAVSAALTGTRNGDWAVPAGTIISGDWASTTQRAVQFRQKVGTDRNQWLMLPAADYGLYIQNYINDVVDTSKTVAIGAGLNVAGNIVLGGPTNTLSRAISSEILSGGKRYMYQQFPGDAGGGLAGYLVNVVADGATKSQLIFREDCQIVVLTAATGVQRPVPFATYTGVVNVTTSAAVSGTAVLNLTTLCPNRFTVAPIVLATSTNALYHAMATAISATSVTITLRHVDNLATSVTVGVQYLLTQMWAGSAGG